MKVLPKLNMNKHPEEATNGSLIDAVNMMVSKDNFMLQTEPTPVTNKITDKLKKIVTNREYSIFYILPCNRELILFVNEDEEFRASLYRYDEVRDEIKFCTKIEWNGGNIVGTFTYNNTELIIAFSEYFDDDSENYPLRTINLGTFDYINEQDLNQLNNVNLHPICPIVKIPSVTATSVQGYANKGWYYIFIRYKISNNTYTQWFNTNETFFVYNTSFKKIISNTIAAGVNISKENIHNYNETTTDANPTIIDARCFVSSNQNIVNSSFNCDIINLDKNYKYYQLGFINITKDSTKCYKTNDININISSYKFDNRTINSYSINDIIKTYNNYYNVKTLINNNNKLYISNYTENNIIESIIKECKNITITIKETIFEQTKQDWINGTFPNNTHILPNQPYNFFIHFVDKYGKVYNGINISNFTIKYDGTYKLNKLNNLIIISPDFHVDYHKGTDGDVTDINRYIKKYCTISFELNKFPNNIIGYFISYEKLDKSVKYDGIIKFDNYNLTNAIKYYFYTNKFNFDDKINMSFNTIKMYNTSQTDSIVTTVDQIDPRVKRLNKAYYIENNELINHNFKVSNILVADEEDNILNSTRLPLTGNANVGSLPLATYYYYLAECVNTNYESFYCSEQKELIPCSNVCYEINKVNNIKTNGCFLSIHHAIDFKDAYYDNTNKYYRKLLFVGATINPFYIHEWYGYDDLPWDSLEYNNNPVVQFYPLTGLNETNENKKSFAAGTILECKNTIDLFQQKNVTVYDNYPKSLDWYNPSVVAQNKFPKTIRRSNIYQDESHNNAWRQFEQEQYKNISENKGDVIKLISIGYYFIAHTEHSMFLFNSTDTLQSEEGKIQLANTDIWDVNYKEVLTSTLGYAGIQKEWSGIVGSFGYIFYDKDSRRLYQYDNQQIKFIDKDITNFIRGLSNHDAKFVEDKKNNRILINFVGSNNSSIILSYNYCTNTFVSRHDYKYFDGYNTKENIYLIDRDMQTIKDFNSNICGNSTIDIIMNTNYETMKYIDNVYYKIREINKTNDAYEYSPVEKFNTYYSGDKLRIYSDICDTGVLNIANANPEKTINKVGDYTKPYWRLGNWHFNALRDNMAEYINNQVSNSGASRMYGNYFITHFEFNTTAPVEVESIDGKLLNATT